MKKDIFLKEKPTKALIEAYRSNNAYASVISKKIDSTYAHTVQIIKELKEEGYIETEKVGRKKIIEVTDEGEKEAEMFLELVENSSNGCQFSDMSTVSRL